MKLNRFVLPLAGFLVIAVVLGTSLTQNPQKGLTVTSALLGKPAPQFALPSVTDPSKTVASADFKGRWYLVNIWGTWCAECRIEHPVLLDIKREGRVPIVGLNYKDPDQELSRAWLAELGDPFTATAADPEGRAAIDWGVYGAPETFLVNPDGIVVHKRVGALTAEQWQREFLPLVDGKAKS